MYQTLLLLPENGILTVVINRADKLNALNKDVFTELNLVLDEVEKSAAIKSVIITGAGSKAFVTHFTQSLRQELSGENVSLTVFAPGGIDTEMTRGSKLRYFEKTGLLQDVQSCARDGLAAMQARRALLVPGSFNRTQLFMTRFVPRTLVAFVARNAYQKALT